MAQQSTVVTNTRADISQMLRKIEEAQAIAARRLQEYNKLGGSGFLTGFDWNSTDIDEQDFLNAMNSLSVLADILGNDGTNFYKLKV